MGKRRKNKLNEINHNDGKNGLKSNKKTDKRAQLNKGLPLVDASPEKRVQTIKFIEVLKNLVQKTESFTKRTKTWFQIQASKLNAAVNSNKPKFTTQISSATRVFKNKVSVLKYFYTKRCVNFLTKNENIKRNIFSNNTNSQSSPKIQRKTSKLSLMEKKPKYKQICELQVMCLTKYGSDDDLLKDAELLRKRVRELKKDSNKTAKVKKKNSKKLIQEINVILSDETQIKEKMMQSNKLENDAKLSEISILNKLKTSAQNQTLNHNIKTINNQIKGNHNNSSTLALQSTNQYQYLYQQIQTYPQQYHSQTNPYLPHQDSFPYSTNFNNNYLLQKINGNGMNCINQSHLTNSHTETNSFNNISYDLNHSANNIYKNKNSLRDPAITTSTPKPKIEKTMTHEQELKLVTNNDGTKWELAEWAKNEKISDTKVIVKTTYGSDDEQSSFLL